MPDKPTYEELEKRIQELKLETVKRKEAEEELAEIFAMSLDLVCIADINDATFLKVNPSFTRILGYSEQELLNRPFLEFIHPDDVESTNVVIEKRLKAGDKILNFKNRYRCKDGTYCWLEWTSHPIPERGITFAVAHDITERKRAEETLERDRDLLQEVMNGARNIHLVYLDLNFNFVRVNQAYAATCGYQTEEMIGKNHFALYPYPENEAIFTRVRDTGIPFEVKDKPFSFPDQPERGVTYWDWSLLPVKEPDGTITGLVFSLVETTERKQAEEKIKASLKEKELLLKEIHHRVKNNMQVISSLLRLQASNIKDKHYTNIFKDCENRIKSMALVHEKLYKTNNFVNINFSEYVKDLINNLRSSFGLSISKVKINVDIKGVQIEIATAIPCGIIINELISNAFKYAFPKDREGEIRITIYPINEDELELIVEDDGIGMQEDQGFENTETLGLRLVKILAEGQLQGKIKLNKRGGTKYNIRFKK